MYFRSATDVLLLADYISANAGTGFNDMEVIGQYRTQHPDKVIPLPQLDSSTYPDPVDKMYATNIKELGCVFDGAAYGQVCQCNGTVTGPAVLACMTR